MKLFNVDPDDSRFKIEIDGLEESYYKNEDSYGGIPTYTKENLSETEKYLLKTKQKNNV